MSGLLQGMYVAVPLSMWIYSDDRTDILTEWMWLGMPTCCWLTKPPGSSRQLSGLAVSDSSGEMHMQQRRQEGKDARENLPMSYCLSVSVPSGRLAHGSRSLCCSFW